MKHRRHIAWLYNELPALVDDGVVTPDTACALRGHYGHLPPFSSRKVALILFGILGTLLIGLGIVLLVAHNWEDLSRPLRTLLAFVPLVLAQGVCAHVLFRHNASTAWRESSALILYLMVCACLALITQTYHISGPADDFLLRWMLLGIPVVYVMRATAPLTLYTVGITMWGFMNVADGSSRYWFWLLALLAVPYYLWRLRQDRHGVQATLIGWFLCPSLCLGVFLSLPDLWSIGGAPAVILAAVFSASYLLGAATHEQDTHWVHRPFHLIGALGVVGTCLVFSFRSAWSFGDWRLALDYPVQLTLIAAIALLVCALLGCAVALRRYHALAFGVAPLVCLNAAIASDAVQAGLMNIYVFVLGMHSLVAGLRTQRYGLLNAGMATIALLINFRFFDSDWSMTLRGVAFIATGVAFLAANAVLARLRRTS